MKRILPIVLVLAMLVLALLSCSAKEKEKKPEEKPKDEATESAQKTTTSKHIDMGIEPNNEGWTFWKEY